MEDTTNVAGAMAAEAVGADGDLISIPSLRDFILYLFYEEFDFGRLMHTKGTMAIDGFQVQIATRVQVELQIGHGGGLCYHFSYRCNK